jgi:hypothetical protein
MAAKKKMRYSWRSVNRTEEAKRQRGVKATSVAPRPQTLAEWMYDMYGWALRVRNDILVLERKVRALKGDPGSPPLPPPPPKDLFTLL